MAGLFRVPKPTIVPAPAPAAETTPAAAIATRDAVAEATRIESRARSGVAGTVATSARGVLAPAPFAAARKSLLGE